jgi:hypothetical protein
MRAGQNRQPYGFLLWFRFSDGVIHESDFDFLFGPQVLTQNAEEMNEANLMTQKRAAD